MSYDNPNHQHFAPEAEYEEVGAASQQYNSFLFTVHELCADGRYPQIWLNKHWSPPVRSSRIIAEAPKTVFRWSEGTLSEDNRYMNHLPDLTVYKTKSVFFRDKMIGFATTPVDASNISLRYREPPLNEWQELQFCGDAIAGLSRLTDAGEQLLYGTGPKWIKKLGLSSHDDPKDYTPRQCSLGGDLPTVVALVAFSCEANKLEKILLQDRAWHGGVWYGHRETHGRNSERGLCVNVYLDPDNPSGSTKPNLSNLEEFGYALIQ